jgi:PPK2 family polyphosphate:nucleotide phosphotransferase
VDYHKRFRVKPGSRVSLKHHDPADTADLKDKAEAERRLQRSIGKLAAEQDKLYAQNTWAVLIIIQAMDAAGKDSLIKHVMSGINPQGCEVYSFKAPSDEELDHDYLWRSVHALPERGRLGIHNRSYYEEVLVVRVHPGFLARQRLPNASPGPHLWARRFREMNHFERYLVDNGTLVLKFFLNVSRAEQRRRFLQRLDQPEKTWKFKEADIGERALWNEYMAAYADMLAATSTKWAPWHIIPADHKWFTRLAVAEIIVDAGQGLKLSYPAVSKTQRAALAKLRAALAKGATETGSKKR